MKKHFLTLILAAMTFVGCNNNSGLYGLLTDFDSRITTLEILCQEFNTNITSLQIIVEAQQSGDYITGITPVMKDGKQIGYTITFANHEPITIYNGENGAKGDKGDKGDNGAAGTSPIVGVAQDTDGKYYWTLNGEWLLNDDGQKIPVTGEKGDKGDKGDVGATGAAGQDGQNGTNGTNGTNGQDGQDGITPQLKIESDYWYISYDNGATWTQLGKATGADGADGAKGDKGDKGDTGATGATGATGLAGADGQDGDSMFQSVTYDSTSMTFILSDGTTITIPRGSINQSGDGYVISGIAQGHYYVDMDLPSGSKWATCNVGSVLPEGSGYYFACGETIRKNSYSKSDYTLTYSSLPNTLTATSYDASYVVWGNQWGLPSPSQWNELLTFCSWNFCTKNEVKGWKITGTNGNSIFLPAAGVIGNSEMGQYVTQYLSGDKSLLLANHFYKDPSLDHNSETTLPSVTNDLSYFILSSNVYNFCTSYFKDVYYCGYVVRAVLLDN